MSAFTRKKDALYKSITAEYGVSKASISKWCSEFSKECQTKALENPDIPNEMELMKENLRLRKELEEAKQLAEENGVVLAEAMTIYHMPLYKKLQEVIQSGKLGKLCMAQMNFGSYKEYDMQNRFFNPNLAGGALLDIGVYAISFIRSFMSCTPDQVVSQVKFAPSGVDEQAGILLMNPAREMATIALTLHAKQPKRGMLAFENGYVEILLLSTGRKSCDHLYRRCLAGSHRVWKYEGCTLV